MIIHYNCTRQFLVAIVFADLPSLSRFLLVVVAKVERIHYARMRKNAPRDRMRISADVHAALIAAPTSVRAHAHARWSGPLPTAMLHSYLSTIYIYMYMQLHLVAGICAKTCRHIYFVTSHNPLVTKLHTLYPM